MGAAASLIALSAALLLLGGCTPPIHDITTDPLDPPAFEAVLPARAGAPNPPGYGGAEVAAIQARLHPEVQPLTLPCLPAEAFGAALETAKAQGFTIVAQSLEAGRIEATATTALMRFEDDLVVRLRPSGTGTRVDVRSKSRIGQSDLGANARRVVGYLAALQTRACR